MLATDDERTGETATDHSDDPHDDALVIAIDRTVSRINRAIRTALEQSEGVGRLTMPQLRCLQAMAADGGVALTTQLARQLNVAVPTMTSMIDGLAERGLVERQQNAADRRQVRLLLTDAGHETLTRYEHIAHDRIHHVLTHLNTRQKTRLRAAFADVAAALDDDAKGGD